MWQNQHLSAGRILEQVKDTSQLPSLSVNTLELFLKVLTSLVKVICFAYSGYQ